MDDKLDSLKKQLASQQVPQAGQQAPTYGEIKTQQSGLKTAAAIDALQSKARAEQWYPEQDPDAVKEGGDAVPLFNKIIDTSLTPLYGIVGAIDYATGKSKKDSLGGAIDYNVNEAKRTMGDVSGNAALGLVGDIVLDPVNWLTAGTTALIPRVAAGAYKGGAKAGVKGALKGAGAAAESRVLETALTTGKLTKGAVNLGAKGSTYLNPLRYIDKAKGKAVKEAATESAEKTSNFTKWLENRSVKSLEAFDDVMGQTALQRTIADKAPLGLMWRKGMGDLAERAVEKSPKMAEYFDKYWKYSNSDWTRISQLRDVLLKTSGREMDDGLAAWVRTKKTGESFEDALTETRGARLKIAKTEIPSQDATDPFATIDPTARKESLSELQKGMSAMAAEGGDEAASILEQVVKQADEASDIYDAPQGYITSDHVENGLRLAAEKDLIDMSNMSSVYKDLNSIIKRGDMGETGVEWWDNIRTNLRTASIIAKEGKESKKQVALKTKLGASTEKFLDVYEAAMAVFKRAAVGASPTAWTNAIFGNLVMAKMVGLDVADPAYMKSLVSADKIVGSRKGAELILDEMFESEGIFAMLHNNPTLFESTTGLDNVMTAKVLKARGLVERVRKTAIDAGEITPNTSLSDVALASEDITKQARSAGVTKGASDTILDEAIEHDLSKKASMGSSRRLLETMNPDGTVAKTNATDFASNELFQSTMATKWFHGLQQKAKQPGNYSAKIGDAIFNGMPDQYGKLDYRYKIGTVLYATKEGLKESELRLVSRILRLGEEDVAERVVTGGVARYKLSAPAAMELANEAFLNYNAMPAMVRVLRNLPLVGAPFAAFTYGMYTKTARTALTNPAVFNKVNLGLEEFSKDETPIEKGLLGMERYDYLDDPAMLNLPGFSDNMVFMNLANMIPYYTLNMFQPPQRQYEGMLPNAMIQTMDRLPVLQDPTGQVIFNYLLLPHLLGEELPKGAFGQTLFPKDAGAGMKAAYAARSLVDPYMPGIVQPFAGLATGIAENAGIVPEGTTQFLPGYTARKTGEAAQGNTGVGVNSKEPAVQRTARAFGASAGFSVQSPVPYKYLDLEEALRNNNSNK